MPLTSREIDVLRLLGRGCRYAEIAKQLGITKNTVASYMKSAYRKLNVRSGPAAVMRTVELRLFGQT